MADDKNRELLLQNVCRCQNTLWVDTGSVSQRRLLMYNVIMKQLERFLAAYHPELFAKVAVSGTVKYGACLMVYLTCYTHDPNGMEKREFVLLT